MALVNCDADLKEKSANVINIATEEAFVEAISSEKMLPTSTALASNR